MTRPINDIARDINLAWVKPSYSAAPYLEAMFSLQTMTDKYYLDSADSVVRYFLANAGTWRGDKARAIKAELKAMLDSKS